MTTTSPSIQNELYCAPVNNTGLDPLQGFDFFVWVQDVCTGKLAWFGLFQSLTLSIRDATETYLELGQRFPIQLNGEINIAWVLEQGMVDMRFVERTFGVKQLRRDMYVTRGPRFQISFDANAAELEKENLINTFGTLNRQNGSSFGTDDLYRKGAEEYLQFEPSAYQQDGLYKPKAQGRYDIHRCKVDNLSMGLMPGRRVAAIRWEGVAEGISWVETSVQVFKSTRQASSGGFINAVTGVAPPTTIFTGGTGSLTT
ncbi:MAG: hypothetical protein ACKPFF_30070 [Planktothrix sp.]